MSARLGSVKSGVNPVIDKLIAEGGENFFHYLRRVGLAHEPSMMLLSERSHYYDCNELKGVKALVNLKKLNLIKHLDSFIHTIYRIVTPDTNFIGCFIDRNIQKKTGLPDRLYKRFLNFTDSRVFVEIDKNDVFHLLESSGFRVTDMTEIDGLIYFSTVNSHVK